jgi:hypothetical protein
VALVAARAEHSSLEFSEIYNAKFPRHLWIKPSFSNSSSTEWLKIHTKARAMRIQALMRRKTQLNIPDTNLACVRKCIVLTYARKLMNRHKPTTEIDHLTPLKAILFAFKFECGKYPISDGRKTALTNLRRTGKLISMWGRKKLHKFAKIRLAFTVV